MVEKNDMLKRVGKRMPYTVPSDNFYGRLQAQVLQQVAREEQEKAARRLQRHRGRLVRLYLGAAAVAASICLAVVMVKGLFSAPDGQSTAAQQVRVGTQQVDAAFDKLTAEEQELLKATYANDVYLSEKY